MDRSSEAQARVAFRATPQGIRKHMALLIQSIYELAEGRLLEFIDETLLQLREKERRLLAMYGAVHGLSSGSSWQYISYDATNCIYAGVWEMWQMQLPPNHRPPTAQSMTNCNTAGNAMEGTLGACGFTSTARRTQSWSSALTWCPISPSATTRSGGSLRHHRYAWRAPASLDPLV